MQWPEYFKKNLHLLLILLGVLVGAASIALMVHNKESQMRQALLNQARSLDFALDWGRTYSEIQADVSAPNREEGVEEAVVDQQRTRMAAICGVYPDCKSAYILQQNAQKQIYFLIDSNPKGSELYTAPGTIYKEASPKVYQVFQSDKIAIEGPLKDRWGTWISAFVPHQLPDKTIIVVGLDIKASDWNKTLWKSAMIPALMTLAFLAMMLVYDKLWRTKELQHEALEKTHQAFLKKAQEDSLTSLPNRKSYEDKLNQTMAVAQRTGARFAVFYLDLDKFRPINETLGHDAGDELVQIAGERFKDALDKADTLARLSGDEFAVILPYTSTHAKAEQLAQKMMDALAEPITLKEQVLTVTVSIGIVFYSENWASAHEITRAADDAMYEAKRAGGNCYRFLQSM